MTDFLNLKHYYYPAFLCKEITFIQTVLVCQFWLIHFETLGMFRVNYVLEYATTNIKMYMTNLQYLQWSHHGQSALGTFLCLK